MQKKRKKKKEKDNIENKNLALGFDRRSKSCSLKLGRRNIE